MSKHRVLPDVDLATEDVRDSRGRRITVDYAEQAAADALASVGRWESLHRQAALDVEIACVGHGNPIRDARRALRAAIDPFA